MKRTWLLVLLAGCVEVDRVDIVVDTRAHTATLSYRDVRGDGDNDLKNLMTTLLKDGTFTAPMPRARVVSEEVVPREGRLDVDVKLTFDDPSQASVHTFDDRHPFRLCAPPGMLITETNGAAKDEQGCVVWAKGARVLRAAAHNVRPVTGGSLLPAFQAWDAKGRPPFDTPAH
jgi:hypothetical protein